MHVLDYDTLELIKILIMVLTKSPSRKNRRKSPIRSLMTYFAQDVHNCAVQCNKLSPQDDTLVHNPHLVHC